MNFNEIPEEFCKVCGCKTVLVPDWKHAQFHPQSGQKQVRIDVRCPNARWFDDGSTHTTHWARPEGQYDAWFPADQVPPPPEEPEKKQRPWFEFAFFGFLVGALFGTLIPSMATIVVMALVVGFIVARRLS